MNEPTDKLRALIERERKSILVSASGLAPLLVALDAYVEHTESRITALERRRSPPLT